ncbi:peptidase M48-like protein [Kitasatospora sp. SolWspMP-SS2h]|uniref:M48 family metalloprotease n=1 Tax=Kitasatospora sp. SolWspMP-SS2h TaxID=1305729 RepID=UPI000DB9A312|nr:M48 family metalloprotease [Kitasatospora sp. SolWspMP-SS2h]RAJ36794.1 peptidase M48-like protein [Kitasatospora sp. SolWspMP-SS2h]
MTPALLLVLAALAFPWAATAAARRLAAAVPPGEACAVITAAALLAAAGTWAVLFGLAHVPFLAALEHLSPARVAAAWPAALPVASLAAAVLAAQLAVVGRRWCEHRSTLGRAWAAAADGQAEGDLLVVPGEVPEAFALPGRGRRAGRVVVTRAMLRALDARERRVLVAHERAHLDGRHHLFAVAVHLAAAVHPALRALRPVLDFHLERWADEAAAEAVGDRRLAATALARAALAGASATRAARGPLRSVSTGPVPQRVQALLGPRPVRPAAGSARAAAGGLGFAVLACAVSSAAVAYGLHEYVESAARAVLGH